MYGYKPRVFRKQKPVTIVKAGGHCECGPKEETIDIKETNIKPSIDKMKQHSMEDILGRLKGKGKG